MAVDPRRLLVLAAIAAAGGVTAAARVLHVSPSAVSQHLAGLEREAGVALVTRTSSGVVLTAAGRALASRAREVQEALVGVENDLAELTGELSGRVGVASYATIASRVVAPAIAQLEHTHPGISVVLHIESEEAALLHRLGSGSDDLVVLEELVSPSAIPGRGSMQEAGRAVPPANAGTTALIADDPYRIVVPALWPDAESAFALLARPWIVGPPGSQVQVALQRMSGVAGVAAPIGHECCEFASALELVAAGLGAAIVPELALRDPPAAVRITSLPEAGLRRLHASWLGRPTRPRASVLAVVHALVDAGQGLTRGGSRTARRV